ncbi:MAG: acetyltransferase [bacterium]|nr:acetyltransferase [bacterium]
MSGSIVIVGAGGHGRVVADLCRSAGREVVGYLDAGLEAGTRVDGAAVLGGDERLGDRDFVLAHAFAIGIGDPKLRCKLAQLVLDAGGELPAIAHAHTTVAPDVMLGRGTVLMAGAVVNPGSTLEDLVVVNTGATVDHDGRIGEGTHLCPGVHLGGNVTCGARAYVGIGASVIQGICIGHDAIVGAGAVVIRDVAEGETVVGCPAAPVR